MVLQQRDLVLSAVTEAAVAMPPHHTPAPGITETSEPRGHGPITLASVALIVEVADTTRSFDLGAKTTRYTRHLVPENWVVNLANAAIVRHWQPGDEGNGQRDVHALDSIISAATIAGLSVETTGLA